MRTTESSPEKRDGAKERDRALERTLRDALALAVSKKAADQALRQARSKAHGAGRRQFRRVAGHLAGYGTLLTYIIWHQRRTQKQSAG
jgi:ferric-dicitrate binding protein FerR (iron transport regulator)